MLFAMCLTTMLPSQCKLCLLILTWNCAFLQQWHTHPSWAICLLLCGWEHWPFLLVLSSKRNNKLFIPCFCEVGSDKEVRVWIFILSLRRSFRCPNWMWWNLNQGMFSSHFFTNEKIYKPLWTTHLCQNMNKCWPLLLVHAGYFPQGVFIIFGVMCQGFRVALYGREENFVNFYAVICLSS